MGDERAGGPASGMVNFQNSDGGAWNDVASQVIGVVRCPESHEQQFRVAGHGVFGMYKAVNNDH